MSLHHNGSYGFHGPYTAPSLVANAFYGPGFGLSVATLGVVVATTLYLLSKSLLGRPLVDKNGNGIPDGPRGLPIVGESWQTS